MQIQLRKILLFLVFVFFISFAGWGQNGSFYSGPGNSGCGPGLLCCNGKCVSANTCAPGNPPPPGLVVAIDSNISLLLPGIGLGVYFIVSSRRKENL